jgi:UDP-N-acetylglucosamine 2-epimerase (non-hydrolysing)
MKALSVVGARPQFIKLKPIHDALETVKVDHVVVHTGQHYDANMSNVFFDGLELPSSSINLAVGSGTQGQQTGMMLERIESVLIEQKPDWVLVYGDTNSTIAAALAAVKVGLKTAHIEAGLRSFNRSMPEEINRVLTDHASDLLLAPTKLAISNLDAEGLAEKSRLVGDVMADLVSITLSKLDPTAIQKALGINGDYVVATIHRASNTDDEAQVRLLVGALASLEVPVVLVAHPRLLSAARRFGIELHGGAIRVTEPLGYVAMLSLISGSQGLITDSGGLQKEAFLLGVACTTLRTESEWPETLEGGMNVLDPSAANLASLAVRSVDKPSSRPFGDGHAAKRIVDLLIATA